MNETALPPAVRPQATSTSRWEHLQAKAINDLHYSKNLAGIGYLRGK